MKQMKKYAFEIIATILIIIGLTIIGITHKQIYDHKCIDSTHILCDGVCTCDGMECNENSITFKYQGITYTITDSINTVVNTYIDTLMERGWKRSEALHISLVENNVIIDDDEYHELVQH